MHEQQIQQIKDALQEMVQLLLSSGEALTPEMEQAVGQAMEHAANRITQLREEEQATPSEMQQNDTNVIPNRSNPPAADAQLLWILAGQQREPFLDYLAQFPSPATQALLANPQELERVISFLSEMMPQGEQPVVDGIQHADLNSSNIWGTKYNQATGQMTVRFQGGSEYEYEGVPPNIYRAFSQGEASAKTNGRNRYGTWWENKNPSLGAAMNQYIKQGNFPYRKIK